jgi:putative PEP-CTERM system histidine kinase
MLTTTIITGTIAIITAIAVVFRKHSSLSNVTFSIGLLSTASVVICDSVIIFSPDLLIQWKKIVYISEVIMVVSWLLFAVSFARKGTWKSISKLSRLLIFLSPLLIVFSVAVPMDEFFYSPEFESEQMLFLGNAGYIFNLILLLYSVLAIIHLEATLKSSSGITRWNIKYTLIGVGGILVMNILYYSHALLYRSLNMNLLPVRTGVFLFSTLVIGFSILRHKVMDAEVVVSRKIVYRSIALLIIGFYFLGLGLIGQGLRYFGPELGENITAFVGLVGAIIILIVILSEKLRRKVAVFINQNFYSQKYDYREQWLKFTKRISLEHSFDELLSSVAEGFMDAIGSRGISIWIKEKGNGGYNCLKTLHIPDLNVKPNKDIIDFLRDKKWLFNIQESNCRELVASNSEFIKKSRTSLIVPLLNLDELIGFIVLREGLAGDDYNYEDYDLLRTLARQTTVAILNARLIDELTEAREMEAMGRLSSFIIHDLKNAASMLSLIAQNAEEHIDNLEFQRDSIRAVINSSEKIKSIIEKLKTLPQKTKLNITCSDLGKCVEMTVMELGLNGKSGFSYKEMAQVKANFDEEEIVKVISNLIINALDAINDDGKIEIITGREEDMGYVRVSDNGCGMSSEFIEKNLFKPFLTTKKKGLGIGLYQCKTIVEAHSGTLKVTSHEGRGSDFTLYLPLTEGE